MTKPTDNRKKALWLAYLSFTASLLALMYFTAFASFSPLVPVSPVVLILAFAPLAGITGIFLRNKEVLVISSIMSLALTILGIVSIGIFFAVSSLLLVISTLVYLNDEQQVEVSEKAKKNALIAASASLIASIAAATPDAPGIYSAVITSPPAVILAVLYLLLALYPVLGIIGIRKRNIDILNTSSAISMVIAVFFGLLLRKSIFWIFPMLLVISAFVYQSGIANGFRNEGVNARHKRFALFLAGISLAAAMAATLYSDIVLISGGCYTYQISPTSGGRICGDFRPEYVIPVIISAVGIAGILMENKLMLYSSASVAFIRMLAYLSPIGKLFLPSFAALVLSAFVYKMGIRKAETLAEHQDTGRHHVLLILLAAVIIWIIAVYVLVQPSSVESSYGYGYDQAPARQSP
ncbi:MAG: hypothetical protein OIN66_10110 [Candidatus Methanoperedens sp.]|nr:hypothetical protein [Candidatus Methanoperedens sp.]